MNPLGIIRMFYTTVVFIVHNESADVKAFQIMPEAPRILWGNRINRTPANGAIASPDKFRRPPLRYSHPG